MLDKYQDGASFVDDNGTSKPQVSTPTHQKGKSVGAATVISKDNITFSTNPKNSALNSPQGNNFMGNQFINSGNA